MSRMSWIYENTLGKVYQNTGTAYNTCSWLIIGASAVHAIANAVQDSSSFVYTHSGDIGQLTDLASATLDVLKEHFFGSLPAVCTSVGSGLFLWSGRYYSLKHQSEGVEDAHYHSKTADTLSIIGGGFYTYGLCALGKGEIATEAALGSGTVLILSRAGSIFWSQYDNFWRAIPLYTRPFQLVSVGMDVAHNFASSGTPSEALVRSILPLSIAVGLTLFQIPGDFLNMPADSFPRRALGKVQEKIAALPKMNWDLKNPGTYYKTGNWLVLGGAVTQICANVSSFAEAANALTQHFVGSAPAALATISSGLFICAADFYKKGSDRGDAHLTRKADWLGAGATFISTGVTCSLAPNFQAFGLGLVSGVVTCVARLGSAKSSQRKGIQGGDWGWRAFSMVGRIPGFVSLGMVLQDNYVTSSSKAEFALKSILPASYIVGYGLFATGDFLNMPTGSFLRRVLGDARQKLAGLFKKNHG